MGSVAEGNVLLIMTRKNADGSFNPRVGGGGRVGGRWTLSIFVIVKCVNGVGDGWEREEGAVVEDGVLLV